MIKIKVVKPHAAPNSQDFRSALAAESKQIAKEMKDDFEKTTKTWKHKPAFNVKVNQASQEISIDVSTKDKIYAYVDEGTRPHLIRARRKGTLIFNTRFKPKTKPYVIGSTAGLSAPPKAYAREVHHPGTEPREFAREIQAKWQPKLAKRLQHTIDQTAKKTSR